jgi:hypothetical protein
VTPVAQYFHDRTQGPRASISAFAGTLLRHYAAPRKDGTRFVQTNADQLDLLAGVFGPDVAQVESGYLMARHVRDPGQLVAALTARFESIRVGVHEGVQVILGYDFEGSVTSSEQRRIAQVFTSTVAGGWYGGTGLGGVEFEGACRQLLRAAYLGTLLAAATLGQRLAVLTLIGGGVFGNPIPLIWDAIHWAAAETEPLLSRDLDVIVNSGTLETTFRVRQCWLRRASAAGRYWPSHAPVCRRCRHSATGRTPNLNRVLNDDHTHIAFFEYQRTPRSAIQPRRH